MATTTPEQWAEVLKEAVQRGVQERRGPVPGARLRQLVAKVALDRGIQFPPTETPNIKFGQFLDQHPGIVAVRRRPEADILVAPTDHPELLLEVPTPHQSLAGIRSDLFYAFTRILPSRQAWYDQTNDRVEWHPKGTELPKEQYTKIPFLTIEEAQEARKKFSASQGNPEIRRRLEQAAVHPAGLAAFTEAIRDSGLRGEWHQCRVRALVDRIGNWAKEASIQWRDAWLTTSSRGQPETSTLPEASQDSRHALATMLQSMDQQDLSRISVPLDVVLKLLQRRR